MYWLWKMKISKLIPNWTLNNKTNLYIFSGIEQIAKCENGVWYIKIERCDKQGHCCKNVSENWAHGRGEGGNCLHLKQDANEMLCDLGVKRPFSCCKGEGNESICNIKWERVE